MKEVVLSNLRHVIKYMIKFNNLMFELLNPKIERLENYIFERSAILFEVEISTSVKQRSKRIKRLKKKSSKSYGELKSPNKNGKRKLFKRKITKVSKRNVYRE